MPPKFEIINLGISKINNTSIKSFEILKGVNSFVIWYEIKPVLV